MPIHRQESFYSTQPFCKQLLLCYVYALRPMTCPFQYYVYKARQKSYRDLPYRMGETSTLFRAYPRNIREMRSEIVREYCPDRDKDCQLPYTDEQIAAMLEEERQVHLANNRADNFNQAVQAWLMAIIASVFMIYFAKQLKK